jgi:two-component system KDP operon response regulator KdpE
MSRVLVVEEDPQLQKMLTLMLQREGHEVAICSDGEGAIERISDESPDLVILDYVLPDCSAALVLSLRERIGRVPLIVAMGGATVPLAVELMRAGASDILTKPFRHPMLFGLIGGFAVWLTTARIIHRQILVIINSFSILN